MAYALRTKDLLTPDQADAFAVQWRRLYESGVIPERVDLGCGVDVEIIKTKAGEDVFQRGRHASSAQCAVQHCDCCQCDARDPNARPYVCSGCALYLCANCAAHCKHDEVEGHFHVYRHVDGVSVPIIRHEGAHALPK